MNEETQVTDTTTSEASEAAAPETTAEAVEQPQEADTQEAAPADAADEGTVLGGKPEDEAAPEGDAPEVEGAPEAYDLSLEGVELDAGILEAADPVLRELNLSNEAANKLVPLANDIATQSREGTVQEITDMAAQQKADWLNIAKTDDVIGGAEWDNTLALSAKGLDALGYTEEHPFRQTLNETGFGNNRDMINVFRRVGELVAEDGFPRSDAVARNASAKDILYPAKEG